MTLFLLAVAQRAAHQPGGDVNDLDHLFIGHAHGADHARRADNLTVNLIGRRHHRRLLVRDDLTFATNVNAHAFSAAGDVEQAHELGFLLGQIEELAQAAHIA